jgi:GTP-binding protein Era
VNHHAGYVALVGRPNVGKSSLLNRLVGQKLAITSHKPQTTRHSILGIDSSPNGQIVFLDTPGIHQRGKHALNRVLNQTARSSLQGADLVLWVVEAGVWTDEDELVARIVRDCGHSFLVVVNKVDRIRPKERLLPILEELRERTAQDVLVPCSALSGDNLSALRAELLARLPEAPPIYPEDQLSDRPLRFFAAELIREQLIRRYHKELPYAVTVEIEQFVETETLTRISALIWVEREGQKAILLGRQGAAMKATATESRRALEEFLGTKVFLQLWIKVRRNWASNEAAVAQLGHGEQ